MWSQEGKNTNANLPVNPSGPVVGVSCLILHRTERIQKRRGHSARRSASDPLCSGGGKPSQPNAAHASEQPHRLAGQQRTMTAKVAAAEETKEPTPSLKTITRMKSVAQRAEKLIPACSAGK